MTTRNTIALTLSLLSLVACGEEATEPNPPTVVTAAEPATEPAPEPVTVGTVPPPAPEALAHATEIGSLARAIRADPSAGEAALTAAGLTPDAFETEVFEIARSPELTAAYRTALEAP